MTEENIKYTKIQKLALEIAANVFHPHAIARIQACVHKTHEDFFKVWWKNFPKKRSELVEVLEKCTEAESVLSPYILNLCLKTGSLLSTYSIEIRRNMFLRFTRIGTWLLLMERMYLFMCLKH